MAVGVVLGVLGLLAGGAAAYYLSARRRGSPDRFHLLGPSDDDDSPHMGPVIPVANAVGAREVGGVPVVQSVRQKLAGIVPGRAARAQTGRRDILADEDTRVFEDGWYDLRRDGSVSSWSSMAQHRATLGSMVQGSLVSLRNVGGAVLAYAAGSRRTREEPSGSSTATYYDEKAAYDEKEKDEKGAFVSLPGLHRAASRPRGGRQGSYASQWTYYEDPFADYDVDSFKMPAEDGYDPDAVEIQGAPSLNDPPPKSHIYSRLAPASVDVTRLTPLSENPSFGTLSDPHTTSSESSHASPLFPSLTTDESRSSHDTLPQSPRRPSSIIDANPPIMSTMRRSDTWWSRFTKTPLLERARPSESSRKSEFEFRDPQPPPRLVPIKESSNSMSPEDPSPKHASRDDPMYASVHHGRSATSLQTSRTADSAVLEKMGESLDIIHGTLSSHGSRASRSSAETGSSSSSNFDARPGPLSVLVPPGFGSSASPQDATPTSALFMQSPTAISPAAPRMPSPSRRLTGGGTVAARVEAFEQHARSPPSSPAAAASRPNKGRNSAYRLAPKPSLFVVNPDRRTLSGDS